jgi:hypothetical protein
MSTAPASPKVNYGALRDYLNGRQKAASLEPATELTPADDTKPVSTGARSDEHVSDVKNNVGAHNVESATPSAANSNGDMLTNSGLEQTVSGEEDSQTRAIKVVHVGNERMALLDPTKDGDLNAIMDQLSKSAVELQRLVAPRKSAGTANKAAADNPLTGSSDHQAVANTIEEYRKRGSDRGRVVGAFVLGFNQTYNTLKRAFEEGSLEQMLAGAGGAEAGAGAGAEAGRIPTGGDAPMPPMPPEAGAVDPTAGAAAGAGDPGAISPDDIAAAFAEAGITPQELMTLLESAKGKLDADPAPSDVKEKIASEFDQTIKFASFANDYMRSGRFALKPAADGTPARTSRDAMKTYIRELRAAVV